MKQVLVVFSNAVNRGGAETFIMKMYRELDKSKYKIDFCVSDKKKGFYDDEIKSYGGEIYYIVGKTQNPFKHCIDFFKLVKRNNYAAVCNIASNSATTIDLLIARAAGTKKLVMRATNSDITEKKVKTVHNALKFLNVVVPTVKFAPSTEAAVFTFGKRAVKNKNFKLLHNAVDLDIYKYDEDARTQVRRELNLENKNVVGHVGRFSTQKNHSFLIEVFNEIAKKDANAHLVLVGIGELMDEIREKVKNYNLSEKVIFLGSRSDVPRLLNAFDVLLFPSFYEGMPNVVIESQATGLPCIVSDTITKEADITGLVTYLPLSAGAEKWCDTVLEKGGTERKNQKEAFVKNGYDIQSAADGFVKAVFD